MVYAQCPYSFPEVILSKDELQPENFRISHTWGTPRSSKSCHVSWETHCLGVNFKAYPDVNMIKWLVTRWSFDSFKYNQRSITRLYIYNYIYNPLLYNRVVFTAASWRVMSQSLHGNSLRIVAVIPSVARKYSGKHVDMSYNIPSGYDIHSSPWFLDGPNRFIDGLPS